MNWNPRDIVLSITALALLTVTLIFIVIEPWAALGIPAVLAAIALIIKAIRGTDERDDTDGKNNEQPKDDAVSGTGHDRAQPPKAE